MNEKAQKQYETGKKIRERANAMKTEGYSEAESAEVLGIEATTVRSIFFTNRTEEGRAHQEAVHKLKDKGYSAAAIAKELGIRESTTRLIINHPGRRDTK